MARLFEFLASRGATKSEVDVFDAVIRSRPSFVDLALDLVGASPLSFSKPEDEWKHDEVVAFTSRIWNASGKDFPFAFYRIMDNLKARFASVVNERKTLWMIGVPCHHFQSMWGLLEMDPSYVIYSLHVFGLKNLDRGFVLDSIVQSVASVLDVFSAGSHLHRLSEFGSRMLERHDIISAMYKGAMMLPEPEDALIPFYGVIRSRHAYVLFFDGLYCLQRYGMDYRDLCSSSSVLQKGYTWSNHESTELQAKRLISTIKETIGRALPIPAVAKIALGYIFIDKTIH